MFEDARMDVIEPLGDSASNKQQAWQSIGEDKQSLSAPLPVFFFMPFPPFLHGLYPSGVKLPLMA